MHIGLYSPSWPPSKAANGIVTYVDGLREGLRRLGHRVTIVAGCADDAYVGDDVCVVRSSGVSRVSRAAKRLFGASSRSSDEFADAIGDTLQTIHLQAPLDVFEMEESFGWCAHVRRRSPAPVVVKLHGPAFLSLTSAELATLGGQGRVRLEGRALREIDAIVAPSRSTLDDTIRYYSLAPKLCSTVFNPVRIPPEAGTWSSEGCDPNTLLFVGRFDRPKGADMVLQAFAGLHASHPELNLVMVGPDVGIATDDGRFLKFEEYANERLPPSVRARVRFLGPLPPDAVRRWRVRSACVLLGSRRESYGYAAAEAMAQGCPIVAFDAPGTNELVQHEATGLLAPLEEHRVFADMIGRMLGDVELAKQFGRAAREVIVTSHGIDQVASEMEGVYAKAVAQYSSGG